MIRILAVGDSNTYGYDPDSCGGGRYPRQERWTGILDEDPDITVVNAGENGACIPRDPEGAAAALSASVSRFQSDLITLMLGTNDLLNMNVPSARTAAERMAAFLDACVRTDPDIIRRTLLIAPPSMEEGLWTNDRIIRASQEMSVYYRTVAEYYRTAFADTSDWIIPTCHDGVHFTVIGHQVFADNLRTVLDGLLQ